MGLKESIHKAALLIDLKGDKTKAIKLLRETLDDESNKSEIVDVIFAKVFLGELLFEEKEFDEAKILFQESIRIFNESDIEIDLVEIEIGRAKKLVNEIS